MKLSRYFSIAVSNIFSHKKHMLFLAFGITISLSISMSVSIWSNTAEYLAINDYLNKQDYQAYILSTRFSEEFPLMKEDLSSNQLVDVYDNIYASYGLFNYEDKSPSYICWPEDQQQQPDDPISITNAIVATQETLDRISFLFQVNGEFSTKNNGIVISWQQAQELKEVLNRNITIGSKVNVSIASYMPTSIYENTLGIFQSFSFESFTINGIYTFQEGVSITESIFSMDVLTDSIIFPLEAITSYQEQQMIDNKVPSMLLVKFSREALTSEGYDNIIDKMNLFSERIKARYPYSYVFLLESPIQALLTTYSHSEINIVFMFPVLLSGVLLTIFMTNIIVESRKDEINLYRDRGADTKQLILLFFIEFLITAIVGIILGLILAFLLAGIIPAFSSTGFSFSTFSQFFLNAQINPLMITLIPLGILLIVGGYVLIKIYRLLKGKNHNSNSNDNSRKKIEKRIFIGINIGIVIIIALALVFTIIDSINQRSSTGNFSYSNTTSAGYTFILFCLLLIFICEGISWLMNEKILASLKAIYQRIIFIDSFFLVNNFNRKKKRLSSISFVLILISSIIVTSLTYSATVSDNQKQEQLYNQGADLRIISQPISYSFKNNLSRIDGINEIVPIIKAKGLITYESYTVYGVDPITYSRVGYWKDSSFS
ncbi:MAG: ABC transporter permease, partial [Promethearchaeota archaeon]